MMAMDRGLRAIGLKIGTRTRVARWRWPRGRLWSVGLACLLLAGCASAPAPMIDDDLEAFTAGLDGVLKVGMTIKDAKTALHAKMPKPSIDTEVPPPVPSANRALRTRRFMIAWPTFNRGTSLVLTIFCDREGKVMRWTTGPLKEDK